MTPINVHDQPACRRAKWKVRIPQKNNRPPAIMQEAWSNDQFCPFILRIPFFPDTSGTQSPTTVNSRRSYIHPSDNDGACDDALTGDLFSLSWEHDALRSGSCHNISSRQWTQQKKRAETQHRQAEGRKSRRERRKACPFRRRETGEKERQERRSNRTTGWGSKTRNNSWRANGRGSASYWKYKSR